MFALLLIKYLDEDTKNPGLQTLQRDAIILVFVTVFTAGAQGPRLPRQHFHFLGPTFLTKTEEPLETTFRRGLKIHQN